ncbi:MAG: helix-turn-helix transcriptional regulator [Betaproteobacteria bacterium]|nr:helix-turn-helix transcriptional regulator [Betaproteobacteria bacterium]
MRLQEFGHIVRRARLARGMTQDELARSAGLSRTTMNQLENGVFPDIGMNKAQAILATLGLGLRVRPLSRLRRPNYVRMARMSASVSFREKLSEGELVRALLTGRIPVNRRPHFRVLLQEVPHTVLKGLVEDVGKWARPGRVAKNLAAIAVQLRISTVPEWLKNA